MTRKAHRIYSQHGSLAYDNLKKGDRDLADIRTTREDFVGAAAQVARLGSAVCQLGAGLVEAQGPHVKKTIYMSFTFVSLTRN